MSRALSQNPWFRRHWLMLGVVCLLIPDDAPANLHHTTELSLSASASVSRRDGLNSTILDRHQLSDNLLNPPFGAEFIEQTPVARASIVHEAVNPDGVTFTTWTMDGSAQANYAVDSTRMAGFTRAEVTYSGEGTSGPFIRAGASTQIGRVFSLQVHRIPGYEGTIPGTFLTKLSSQVAGVTAMTTSAGGDATTGVGFASMAVRIRMRRHFFPDLGSEFNVFNGQRWDRVDIENGQSAQTELRSGTFAGEPSPTVQLLTNSHYRVTVTLQTNTSVELRGSGSMIAVANAANTLHLFPYNEPIFLDLPEGITVSAPLVGIVNNRFLLPGDANRDGRVDGEDFLIWQANFGAASGATWDEGDFNGDGRVDGEDFLIWQASFGSSVTTAFTPEPGTAGLLLLLAPMLNRRIVRAVTTAGG